MAEEKMKSGEKNSEEKMKEEMPTDKGEKEKTAIKEEKKKPEEKKIEHPKKETAVANGLSLRISLKYAMAICRVIRGKEPRVAIKRLEEVISERRAIPMAGLEVGHKKGMAGGRFPKTACKEIIKLIKQVEANSVINEIENPIITVAKANLASAPYRRGGRKSKRAHVFLEVRDKIKLAKRKK